MTKEFRMKKVYRDLLYTNSILKAEVANSVTWGGRPVATSAVERWCRDNEEKLTLPKIVNLVAEHTKSPVEDILEEIDAE